MVQTADHRSAKSMREFVERIGEEMGRDLSPQIAILEAAFIDSVDMLAEVTDQQFEKMDIPLGLIIMIRKRLQSYYATHAKDKAFGAPKMAVAPSMLSKHVPDLNNAVPPDLPVNDSQRQNY